MGRKPTKCQKKCSLHQFSLRPVHYSAYFSREVVASFCPASLKHPAIHPIFNKDRKHYTSSFSLREDLVKYESNDALYKAEHNKFCQEVQTGKSNMLQPKPKSKCQYCHACKDYYSDYLEHIHSLQHKTKIRANRFSDYIGELINEKYPTDSASVEHQLQSISQEDSVATEKEFVLSTPSINSQVFLQPPINEFLTASPFKFGRGAFEFHGAGSKPELMKQIIVIEEEHLRDGNENELAKKMSTECEKGSPSAKFQSPIILNFGS